MTDLHPDFAPMTSAAFRADPYPVLAWMREHAPVAKLDTGLSQSWSVFRYADAQAVLLDPDGFSSDRSLGAEGEKGDADLAYLFDNMISASGEKHRRLRMIGNRVFMPKFIEAYRPAIEAVVAREMDRALARGTFDMVEEFSARITVAMISAILGLPEADMEQIRKWTAVLGDNSGASTWLSELDPALVERGRVTGIELTEYFAAYVAERRRAPREGDLISAFIEAEVEGERLTDAEVLSTAMLLLLAGNETTTNLITNFVRLLDAFPDQAARLRADPALIDRAVEETLRLRNSIRNIDRFATRDTEIAGVPVPAGGKVVVWLSAANRDPAVFDRPDDFLPDRPTTLKHLAFGYGMHMCLGAPLARMETRIAGRAILERTRAVEIAGPAKLGPNANFDNVTELPVRFVPR